MARYLVLWTGGLDSTYLCDKLLSEDHQVDAVYMRIRNNPRKTKRELKAIARIHENYLRLYHKFAYLGQAADYDITNTANIDNFAAQIPLLLNTLIYAGSPEKYDYVALGYTMGDCAISYLEDIKKIYSSYGGLMGCSLPELVFPLTKIDKRTSYESLPETIRPLLTWCESVEKTNGCDECMPCKRMKMLGLGNSK